MLLVKGILDDPEELYDRDLSSSQAFIKITFIYALSSSRQGKNMHAIFCTFCRHKTQSQKSLQYFFILLEDRETA